MASLKKVLNQFLKKVSMDDIKASYDEPQELCIGKATIVYGNREVSIYLDDSDEPHHYCLDTIGFNDYLVES